MTFQQCEKCPASGWDCTDHCVIDKLTEWQERGSAFENGMRPSQGHPGDGSGKPDHNSHYNGWERGIVTENRPGVGKVAILNSKGRFIRNKEWAENRALRDEYRRLRSGQPINAE